MNVRPYSVRKADWHSDRTAMRRVRLDVFVHKQHAPEKFEWDGLDESCLHALVSDAGDSPLGTGRLLDNGQIGRMAVLLPGVAPADEAHAYGHAKYPLHAQVQVIPYQ